MINVSTDTALFFKRSFLYRGRGSGTAKNVGGNIQFRWKHYLQYIFSSGQLVCPISLLHFFCYCPPVLWYVHLWCEEEGALFRVEPVNHDQFLMVVWLKSESEGNRLNLF